MCASSFGAAHFLFFFEELENGSSLKDVGFEESPTEKMRRECGIRAIFQILQKKKMGSTKTKAHVFADTDKSESPGRFQVHGLSCGLIIAISGRSRGQDP